MNNKLKINKKPPSYLKRSSEGGLLIGFIYVLTFLSILFLIIWQTFESESNKASEQLINERLLLIEDQLSIVDETNNDSLTDISSSIQFLDKEIRKLWDLSNKRNKVNIQNLTSQTAEIQSLLSKIEEDINSNQKKLTSIEQSLKTNIEKIRDLELTADELAAYKLNLSNIDTQLILLEDSVQALNNYKNQLNQAILEIQTEITIIKNSQNIE
jgi:DNA repair exonuclease SbcCD ATPase subunit|tara:strand:+ start:513 stop:1151 length:639 start_codon:yes stop_codon:yes gene_type:complete